MYGLSAFFIGEQRVTDELGPIMRAAPTEEMRIFLSTQIADEARHVRFFNRFYDEVGVLEGADDLAERLRAGAGQPEPGVRRALRRDARRPGRPARRRARGHGHPGRGDHALPHGDRGGAGAHRPALHHRLQRGAGDAAGVRRGVRQGRPRRAPPRRLRRQVPHRHGALPTIATATRSSAPWSSRCRSPRASCGRRSRPPDDDDFELFGVSMRETQAFAAQCLTRRLKVIGLAG